MRITNTDLVSGLQRSHIGERTHPRDESQISSLPHAQLAETQASGHSSPQWVGQQGPSRQCPPVPAQSSMGESEPASHVPPSAAHSSGNSCSGQHPDSEISAITTSARQKDGEVGTERS